MKIAKSRPFGGKGFLNKYVFFVCDKEPPPSLKMFLERKQAPTKAQKKNPEEKKKVEKSEIRPTAIHTHGALHAG